MTTIKNKLISKLFNWIYDTFFYRKDLETTTDAIKLSADQHRDHLHNMLIIENAQDMGLDYAETVDGRQLAISDRAKENEKGAK